MANLHRTLAALLAAPALMVPSAGAFAQPPAAERVPAAPPATVCLTNACADRPAEIGKARTVPEAVAAGDSVRVRELGGSPQDVLAAMTQWIELEYQRKGDFGERQTRWLESERRDYRHLADRSLGEFVFQPISFVGMKPGDGMPIPGGGVLKASFLIQRRSPAGCQELVIVHEDGRGVPSDALCTR